MAKRDPYNTIERWNRWKEKNKYGIDGNIRK
jgi:hypothetical protein